LRFAHIVISISFCFLRTNLYTRLTFFVVINCINLVGLEVCTHCNFYFFLFSTYQLLDLLILEFKSRNCYRVSRNFVISYPNIMGIKFLYHFYFYSTRNNICILVFIYVLVFLSSQYHLLYFYKIIKGKITLLNI